MRPILLGLIALGLTGCGAEVTNTVIQPVSMCTTFLAGQTVRVTLDGLDAQTLCHQYALNRAVTGERWGPNPPREAPSSLPTICRLTNGSGETQVIVADRRSDRRAQAVCRQWRASGWFPASRYEG